MEGVKGGTGCVPEDAKDIAAHERVYQAVHMVPASPGVQDRQGLEKVGIVRQAGCHIGLMCQVLTGFGQLARSKALQCTNVREQDDI